MLLVHGQSAAEQFLVRVQQFRAGAGDDPRDRLDQAIIQTSWMAEELEAAVLAADLLHHLREAGGVGDGA